MWHYNQYLVKACSRRSFHDRTFQVANRKSFLRLLLVFIVLICPIFYSFSFVIRVFLRGRVISPSHNLLTSEGPVLVVTLQASSHTVAVLIPNIWCTWNLDKILFISKYMTDKITLNDLKMADLLLRDNCVKIVSIFFRLNFNENMIKTL
jgi:hypothetical protein